MIRKIKAHLIFYKKIFELSLIMTFAFGLFSFFLFQEAIFEVIGISYFIFSIFFHFFLYEIRNPDDYYFYYNFGFSKAFLWSVTIIYGFMFFLISISL